MARDGAGCRQEAALQIVAGSVGGGAWQAKCTAVAKCAERRMGRGCFHRRPVSGAAEDGFGRGEIGTVGQRGELGPVWATMGDVCFHCTLVVF